MSSYLELEGKRALVTGGTKGVGAAVVTALREAGARVLTTARKCPQDVGKAEFVAADVSTAEGCAAVADAVRKQLGGLDILVHVVGGVSDPEGDPNKVPQRTWMGMPVGWDWKNWNKGVWNTDDHRLFPPKRIGIGWTINIHELQRRLRVVG